MTVNILSSNSTNATVVATALSAYISSISNTNVSLNSTYTLEIGEIDAYLSNVVNGSLTIDTNSSFIMIQPPQQADNDSVIVLGASVISNQGGTVVDTSNEDDITKNFDLSTAAIISNDSLTNVTSLNIMIINDPTSFINIDNSTNKTLASSLVVFSVRRSNNITSPISISLYFQVLNDSESNDNRKYLCSYYNTSNFIWDEFGCTEPQFNTTFNRYECTCNHTTTFALLFLPQSLLANATRTFDAQDIASLVFQSISIICFLVIIIHAIFTRIRDPLMSLQAYNLLPLISGASTTMLFVFYIALGMTVYTNTSSPTQTECFLSSTVLMFFTYFFLIFMFCVKTSVGYFNYLRFVHLFPEPSQRKLSTMLLISFLISITWVAFAAGFNSNSSFQITQLYPYKLCWFARDVIYYFLTIPACLFISINIMIFILVGIRIINHARNATSPHQSYERMKRCVIILLSSCITQGIGWLFGPFISFINPSAGNILGWFFIIFNGLEGLWAILLYTIIRLQQMDEQKRVIARKDVTKSTTISSVKSIKGSKNGLNGSSTRQSEISRRNSRTKSLSFNDRYDLNLISEC